jgi:formylglycine-generating enzyme required for sulfatase activity
MDLLAAQVPAKKAECLEKNVAIYQRQYVQARGEAKVKAGEEVIAALGDLAETQVAAGHAADAGTTLRQAIAVATAVKSEHRAALQARLAGMAQQQQSEKQIAALKAKLEADPADDAARKELVRLYLVEMDAPAEAAKYIGESLDEATRKYLPAAAKPMEDAPELACRELGDWYNGLADQAAAPSSKAAMLQRAQGYYERYLVLHTDKDLGRTAAALTLKRIEDALEKLGPAVPAPKSGSAIVTLDLGKGVAMRLVLIRPGKFLMGEGKEQREVTISKPFYMGATEVTQAQYEAVMRVNPSHFKGAANPVDKVSWFDAMDFCKKLSERTRQVFRLPTEAEWEYACRAGTTTRFSFGDSESDLGDYAWHKGNSGEKTHPVAQKKPNAWGLYDMHGNVWEWCADWYGSYTAGPLTDPQGAASGSLRVLRGGSWRGGDTVGFRCAYRDGSGHPANRGNYYGFRCARTLP